MFTTPVITLIAILAAIVIFVVVSFKRTIYKQNNMNTKPRIEAIADIVKSVEDYAIKKESEAPLEHKIIKERKNLEQMADRMKNVVKLNQKEQDEFWKWVDSEVSKMSQEELAELEHLINK